MELDVSELLFITERRENPLELDHAPEIQITLHTVLEA